MNQNTLKARNTHYTGLTHKKVHVQDEQKQ